MISLPKHAFQYILLCVIGLVLAGCGGSSTIGNGANLANLSGAANSQKTYSIKLPDNTVSLIIEAAGSPDITLDLLDASGNSLGACAQPLFCVLDTPAAGTYKLRLKATAAYAGVNLSASWGGPGVSVLQNNVALGGLSGNATTVLLKSLYLEPDPVALLLELAGSNDSYIELLDRYGNAVWPCGPTNCLVKSIEAGLYFVRLQGTGTFADTSLKARWGDSFGATLENGVPRTGLTGTAGSQFVESFFLPEGVDSILVAANKQGVGLQLVSADDHSVWFNCQFDEGSYCFARDIPPGLYYVVGSLHQDVENFSLTLRFGGANHSSLENGQSSEPQSASLGALYVESFYVDEGATSAAFVSNWNAEVRVYDGNGLLFCEFQPCVLSNLQPGSYFATVKVIDDTLTESVSSSVAMGGPATGTLVNGQTKQGTLAFPMASKVESFYAGPGVDSFVIALSGSDVIAAIYNQQGSFVAHCHQSMPCVVGVASPGVYFVHQDSAPNAAAGSQYSIALALGGENHVTLANGQSSNPQPANQDALYVESFYVAEGVTSAAFVSNWNAEVRVYDGNGLLFCEFQPCVLSNLQPGSYFATVKVIDDTLTESVSSSVAMGGPATGTLVNGQTKQGTLAFPMASKVESFYAGPGVDSFVIALSGSDVIAAIYNQQGSFVAHCHQSMPCVVGVASPGVYFVHQDSAPNAAAGSQYSVALALGGENHVTLDSGQSSEPYPEIVGAQYVESFYVSEGATSAAFVANWNTAVRIYDANGLAFCEFQPCVMANLQPGSYFATITVIDDVHTDSVNSSLALGGPGASTLVNGQIQQRTVAFYMESKVESIYAGPGVDSFAVAVSAAEVHTTIYDQQGVFVAHCDETTPCVVKTASPGAYFLHTDLPAFLNAADEYSISLALGGQGVSTIKAGDTKQDVPAVPGEVFVNSFYYDSSDGAIGFAGSVNTVSSIFTADGELLCENQFCAFPSLSEGSYFVASRVMEQAGTDTISLSLVNASAASSSLHNGETLAGFSGKQGASLLFSVYMPEFVDESPSVQSLLVGSTIQHANIQIYDSHGVLANSCWYGATFCPVQKVLSSAYFVLLNYEQDMTDVGPGLTATWVGENASTIKKDVVYSMNTSFSAQSFHLDAASTVTLQSNPGGPATHTMLRNARGENIVDCIGSCVFPPLESGDYFLGILYPANNEEFSYSLSW